MVVQTFTFSLRAGMSCSRSSELLFFTRQGGIYTDLCVYSMLIGIGCKPGAIFTLDHLVSLILLVSTATGSLGLITTISAFGHGHLAPGIVGIFVSLGWAIQTFGGGVMYRLVWGYKMRNEEISWANATNQFKSESFKTVVLHQSRI